MQAIFTEQSTFAPKAVVSVATLAALAVLGLVLGYWTWVWLAPHPEPRAQPPAEPVGGGASAGSLFGSVRRDQSVAAPTGIAIKLLGVVAASGDRRGYAVVQLEAREILAVHEGEDIAPGIRLAEVHADHVVLDRSGMRETLTWPEKKRAVNPLAPQIK